MLQSRKLGGLKKKIGGDWKRGEQRLKRSKSPATHVDIINNYNCERIVFDIFVSRAKLTILDGQKNLKSERE